MKQSKVFDFFAKVWLLAAVFNLLRFMSNDDITKNFPYALATALSLVWFWLNAKLGEVALKRETESEEKAKLAAEAKEKEQ